MGGGSAAQREAEAEAGEDDRTVVKMSWFQGIWWRLHHVYIGMIGLPPIVFYTGLLLFFFSFTYQFMEVILLFAYKHWFLSLARAKPDVFAVTKCSQNCSYSAFNVSLFNRDTLRCNRDGMCTDSPSLYELLDKDIKEGNDPAFTLDPDYNWNFAKGKENSSLYSIYAGYMPESEESKEVAWSFRYRSVAFRNFWCRRKFHQLSQKLDKNNKADKTICQFGDDNIEKKCFKPKMEKLWILKAGTHHECNSEDPLHYDPRLCPQAEVNGTLYTYLRYFHPHRIVRRYGDPVECNLIPCCRPAWTFSWMPWTRVGPDGSGRLVFPYDSDKGRADPCPINKASTGPEWSYRRRRAQGLDDHIHLELWEGIIEAFRCPICVWSLDFVYTLSRGAEKSCVGWEPGMSGKEIVEGCLLKPSKATGKFKCPLHLNTLRPGELHKASILGNLPFANPNDYEEVGFFCNRSHCEFADISWSSQKPEDRDKDSQSTSPAFHGSNAVDLCLNTSAQDFLKAIRSDCCKVSQKGSHCIKDLRSCFKNTSESLGHEKNTSLPERLWGFIENDSLRVELRMAPKEDVKEADNDSLGGELLIPCNAALRYIGSHVFRVAKEGEETTDHCNCDGKEDSSDWSDRNFHLALQYYQFIHAKK